MPEPTDDELDMLLARGRMSGAARERVLENVLRATSPPKRSARFVAPVFATLTGLAAAAAVVLFFRSGHDSFTAKGGAYRTIGLEATCKDGVCHIGGTLILRVDDVPESAHLAAYAVRDGAPRESTRIWYFPEANGTEPTLVAQPGPQLVRRGITLGPEHTPGRYVVHAVIAKRPLSREEALDDKNHDVIARASRSVEVEP
jgi:hypothetical protein